MTVERSAYAPDPRSPDTWQGALALHARVVGAVIMRDLQTRFGTSYLGYFFSILIPFGHLIIILVIYTILRRGPPLGVDLIESITITVLPFVVWTYTHRQMFISLSINRILLSFPGVTITDLLIARAIVEICTCTLVVTVVWLTVSMAGHPLNPNDTAGFFFALLHAYLLGIATGMLFGALGFVWPGALMLGSLLIPLYWVTSGMFFLPDAIPEVGRRLLMLFPLTHVINDIRLAYYSEYTSDFSAIVTADMLIFSILAAAMVAQHVVRRFG